MDKLKIAIKNKNIDHMYFFLGEEVYLSQYYLNALKDVIKCDETFDFVALDADDLSTLQESVEGMPVMSEKKMVVIKGLDLSDELKNEDVELISGLIEEVPPFTVLVFVSRTIKKNSKIYKLLAEKCTVCTFEHQKPVEVIKWLLNNTIFPCLAASVWNGTAR